MDTNETGREPTDAETVCTYPDCRCPVDAAEGFCLKGLPIHGPDETAQTSLRAECEHGHLARKCETCALIEREAECERLRAEVEKLQKDRDRLWQDRYDLLSVTSTDGLLSSEWVMRSATAERKAKDFEARNTRLTARVAELEAKLGSIEKWAQALEPEIGAWERGYQAARRWVAMHFKHTAPGGEGGGE